MLRPCAADNQHRVEPLIETCKVGPSRKILRVGTRDARHLPGLNRGRGIGAGGPCLYFDKHDRSAAPRDDIDFAGRQARAAVEYALSLDAQQRDGDRFRPAAAAFAAAAVRRHRGRGKGRAPGGRSPCEGRRSPRQRSRRRPERSSRTAPRSEARRYRQPRRACLQAGR
jgi:hypothetical protein